MEDLIKALQIFLKYGNLINPSYCAHDVFCINIDPRLVSDNDKQELEKLSFDSMYEEDCFVSLRFGSC